MNIIKNNRISIVAVICWFLVFLLLRINRIYQLESNYLNAIYKSVLLNLVLLIPIFTLVILSLKASSLKKRAFLTMLTIFLTLILFFPIGFRIIDLTDLLKKGKDSSYEQVQLVRLEDSNVAVYVTNCGATCDWGIVVEQQRPFFKIFKKIKYVKSWYHASELTLEKSGKNQVRVIDFKIDKSRNTDIPQIGETWNF